MKTAVVVRYGGIGDAIQTSSILPGLKEQGYRVVLNTTMIGEEVLRHDPHIDDWIVQGHDEIPMEKLGDHWQNIASRCDKFINLSESVEATLYSVPHRGHYYWTREAREYLMDRDQITLTHLIAGVPLPARYRFYPTQKEAKWARKQRKKLGGNILMWVLSGSSVHKIWPYVDQVLARLMLETNLKVVICGDPDSQILEQGWENESRIKRTCGRWSMRQSLSFAREADLVVGPETGILYSIGLEETPKIVTLGHSSVNCLYRGWKNCAPLVPVGCECYPCFQIHYGFDQCRRHPDIGVADCQAKISAEMMWSAIVRALQYLSYRKAA